MTNYSTSQVAKLLGIGYDTLHRWIQQKKIPAPKAQLVGGVRVRLWSKKDIEAAEQYKASHYWGKGSTRKPGKKQSQ
jgi:excisionase family DNA binding protein